MWQLIQISQCSLSHKTRFKLVNSWVGNVRNIRNCTAFTFLHLLCSCYCSRHRSCIWSHQTGYILHYWTHIYSSSYLWLEYLISRRINHTTWSLILIRLLGVCLSDSYSNTTMLLYMQLCVTTIMMNICWCWCLYICNCTCICHMQGPPN